MVIKLMLTDDDSRGSATFSTMSQSLSCPTLVSDSVTTTSPSMTTGTNTGLKGK